MRTLSLIALALLAGCSQPRLDAQYSVSDNRVYPTLSTDIGGFGLKVTP